MSIVVHIVNTPKSDVREAYDAGWRLLDGQGVHHPSGRLSHTAWLVDDVLHVVEVWASSDDMGHFMSILGPILDEAHMVLAQPPEVGELLNIVRPD